MSLVAVRTIIDMFERLELGSCRDIWYSFYLCVVLFFFCSLVHACVCDDDLFCFFVMFSILHNATALAC